MESFKLVLKSIVLAIVVLLGLQLKVNDRTIESQLESLLTESEIPKQLNQVAAGAIKFSKDSYFNLQQFITKKIDDQNSPLKKKPLSPVEEPTVKAEFH